MAGSRVNWKGKEVGQKVRLASVRGINVTLGSCIITAKQLVHVKTSLLQGSIRAEPATPTASGARGQWGSFDVNYALWQEVLPEPRGRAYLRPSGDTHYRSLPRNIKAAL
jgi:hypothetical protein